jgi:hypothetical protein
VPAGIIAEPTVRTHSELFEIRASPKGSKPSCDQKEFQAHQADVGPHHPAYWTTMDTYGTLTVY